MVSDRIRVLVVDDHETYRDAMTGLLSLFDEFDVVGGADGVSPALDVLASQPIDLVLLDVHMPEIDGLSGAKMILDLRPNVRVMLCSTADRVDLRAFVHNEHVVFVSKADLDPQQMIEWARSW